MSPIHRHQHSLNKWRCAIAHVGFLLKFSSPVERIFVIKDGFESGPFTQKELRLHWANGSFEAEDLAWQMGQKEWLPLSEFFAAPFTQTPSEFIESPEQDS